MKGGEYKRTSIDATSKSTKIALDDQGLPLFTFSKMHYDLEYSSTGNLLSQTLDTAKSFSAGYETDGNGAFRFYSTELAAPYNTSLEETYEVINGVARIKTGNPANVYVTDPNDTLDIVNPDMLNAYDSRYTI